jgi:hypothetical protein
MIERKKNLFLFQTTKIKLKKIEEIIIMVNLILKTIPSFSIIKKRLK